jgi:hypothetical protein
VGAVPLVLILVLLPIASAGSPDDPEIRDNVGDARISVFPVPVDLPFVAGPPPEALDILASWFHDETNSSISVTMLVADLSGVDEWDNPSLGFIRWGTRFEMTNYDETSDDYWEKTWIMGIDLNSGPIGWRASPSPPSRDAELQPLLPATYSLDRGAGTLTVTVTRTHLGDPRAGDAMTRTGSLHDANWGPVSYGINYQDYAPDGTYPSRDFVFQLDTGESHAVQNPPAAAQERQTPMSILAVLLGLVLAARRR